MGSDTPLMAALLDWMSAQRLLDTPSMGEVTPSARETVNSAFTSQAATCLGLIGVSAIALDEADDELTVFVGRKPKRAELDILPEQLGDLQLEYVSELISAVQPHRLGPPTPQLVSETGPRVRCGASISLGNDRAAGTLGALVRDRMTGALYGLTCNHVTGGCNNTPVGMPVVSPAVLDVTSQTPSITMIGRHDCVLPLRQGQAHVVNEGNTDAALFSIVVPDQVSSWQGDHCDTPTEICPPEPMKVEKVGRTTGLTHGVLKDAVATELLIPYKHTAYSGPDHHVTFQGVCYFSHVKVVRNTGGAFAAAGDSGSLVMTAPDAQGRRKAVGLLIGAGQRTGYGYVLPIGEILDRFGVDLVANHGGQLP